MTQNKNSTLPEIAKGSVLYRVYDDRRDGPPREVTVLSVGRQWIAVDDYRAKRFDKETLRAEGGRSRLYPSKEAYEAEVARQTAWEALRQRVGQSHRIPEEVSTANVAAALELLSGGPATDGLTTFHVRINGGDEQPLVCRTESYGKAACAAFAMLEHVSDPGGSDVVEIRASEPLPDFQPYRYVITSSTGYGVTVAFDGCVVEA